MLGSARPLTRGLPAAALLLALAASAARKPVIKELDVPAVADMREPVTLRCRFDLSGGKLYSVKWYKDDQEFYRYMPDETPPQQTFSVPYVILDEKQSDEEKVTLTHLTFNSSGSFRCEVSVEAPSFDTAHQSANMSVMALPRDAPHIEGVAGSYSLGEWVLANCTSDKSNPVSHLSWFINGAKAEQWLLDQMPPTEDSISTTSMGVEEWLRTRFPRKHSVDERGLHTTSLGLRFVAERRFFQGNPARVELRCEAAVGEQRLERTAAARLAHAANQQLRSASHRLNGAHLMTSSCSVLSALLTCSLLRLLVS